MPFDGSGNYTPAAPPNFPAVGGTVISSNYYNNVINDIAGALSNTITRDGQGKPSADIDWNGKSLTNVNNFKAVSATFTKDVTIDGNATVDGDVTAKNVAVGGTLTVKDLNIQTSILDIKAAGTETAQIKVQNADHNIGVWVNDSQTFIGSITNSKLSFMQNNTERMQLDTLGNLTLYAGSCIFHKGSTYRGSIGPDISSRINIDSINDIVFSPGRVPCATMKPNGTVIFETDAFDSPQSFSLFENFGEATFRVDKAGVTTLKVFNNALDFGDEAQISVATGSPDAYAIFSMRDGTHPARLMKNGNGVKSAIDMSLRHEFHGASEGYYKVIFDENGNVAIGREFGEAVSALDIQRAGTTTSEITVRNSNHAVNLRVNSDIAQVGTTTSTALSFITNNIERYRINREGLLVDSTGFEVGLLNFPLIVTSDTYFKIDGTCRGKQVSLDNVNVTFYLSFEVNSGKDFPVGSVITIVNLSAKDASIESDSENILQLAGTSYQGYRHIAPNGVATLLRITPNIWLVYGPGVA